MGVKKKESKMQLKEKRDFVKGLGSSPHNITFSFISHTLFFLSTVIQPSPTLIRAKNKKGEKCSNQGAFHHLSLEVLCEKP